MADPTRRHPLEGIDLPTGPVGDTVLVAAPPARRWALQGDGADAAAAVLGVPAPDRVNRASSSRDRAMLRLGPDEWLLLADPADPALDAVLAGALAGVPHGLVDVSHRQTALMLFGSGAVDVLAAGMPLDLHPTAFPVGMATRTVFEKAEIVLWRTGPDAFRVEVWRSVAPYVAEGLVEAMRTADAFRRRAAAVVDLDQ